MSVSRGFMPSLYLAINLFFHSLNQISSLCREPLKSLSITHSYGPLFLSEGTTLDKDKKVPSLIPRFTRTAWSSSVYCLAHGFGCCSSGTICFKVRGNLSSSQQVRLLPRLHGAVSLTSVIIAQLNQSASSQPGISDSERMPNFVPSLHMALDLGGISVWSISLGSWARRLKLSLFLSDYNSTRSKCRLISEDGTNSRSCTGFPWCSQIWKLRRHPLG